MSSSAATAAYSADVYWLPRSLWKIARGATRPWVWAIRSALLISSVRMCGAIAHPTTMRECRSITVARYSHPSPVRRYVISPTSLMPGVSEVKSRRIRSGRASASSAGIVVRFFVRGWTPAICCRRMIARIMPADAGTPAVVMSACTRRCPLTPFDAV